MIGLRKVARKHVNKAQKQVFLTQGQRTTGTHTFSQDHPMFFVAEI